MLVLAALAAGCGSQFALGPSGATPQATQHRAIHRSTSRYIANGTTIGGGKILSGTIFKVTTSGAEAVLHEFKNASDASGLGTIFALTP